MVHGVSFPRWKQQVEAITREEHTEMTTGQIELDCQLTVGEVAARYPTTVDVFNRYGIDLCCGSSVSVREAAHRDGLEVDALCADLRQAALAPKEN